MIKMAFVHDWLVGIGGAERVLQAMCELYPSPIYTLVCDRKKMAGSFFADKEVQTSFLQSVPFGPQLYRYFLPLFPRAIERLNLQNFPLVISSSHAVAKGFFKKKGQIHVCYCHTPMRYAWDLQNQYVDGLGILKKNIAKFFLQRLKNWDLGHLAQIDEFVANSRFVAERIKKHYGRDAKVIYPPVAVEEIPFQIQKDNFYLTVSRFVPYKKIDLIVESFAHLPDQELVVIGQGPEWPKIRSKAKKNVFFLGHLPDKKVREYMARAKAFIFAAIEDFGIAPVEAQAAGTPVIAYGEGGILETVKNGVTGIFFNKQNPQELIDAIRRFETIPDRFDPQKIIAHAKRFSTFRFKQEFKQFIDCKIETHYENHHSCRRQRQ